MTPREKDCLEAFKRLSVSGASPSFEEVATEIGLKSRSGVLRMVNSLVAQGLMRRPSAGVCWRRVEVVEPTGPSDRDLALMSADALWDLAGRVHAAIDRREEVGAA